MASFAFVAALGGVIARKVEDPVRASAGADPPDPDAAPVIDRWWFDSSFELKHGLVVREVPLDIFPPGAFERLFFRR